MSWKLIAKLARTATNEQEKSTLDVIAARLLVEETTTEKERGDIVVTIHTYGDDQSFHVLYTKKNIQCHASINGPMTLLNMPLDNEIKAYIEEQRKEDGVDERLSLMLQDKVLYIEMPETPMYVVGLQGDSVYLDFAQNNEGPLKVDLYNIRPILLTKEFFMSNLWDNEDKEFPNSYRYVAKDGTVIGYNLDGNGTLHIETEKHDYSLCGVNYVHQLQQALRIANCNDIADGLDIFDIIYTAPKDEDFADKAREIYLSPFKDDWGKSPLCICESYLLKNKWQPDGSFLPIPGVFTLHVEDGRFVYEMSTESLEWWDYRHKKYFPNYVIRGVREEEQLEDVIDLCLEQRKFEEKGIIGVREDGKNFPTDLYIPPIDPNCNHLDPITKSFLIGCWDSTEGKEGNFHQKTVYGTFVYISHKKALCWIDNEGLPRYLVRNIRYKAQLKNACDLCLSMDEKWRRRQHRLEDEVL